MRRIQVKQNSPGSMKKLVTFDKQDDEIEIVGLVDADKKGDYELQISAIHKVPNGKGRIKIRAIARNGARVNLVGEIIIEENCNRVDDFMDLKVLILDEKSSARVDPRLEIKSDQVKASHSASVSMVDANQISYMMTRGIDRDQAMELIRDGFLSEISVK